MSFIYTGVGPIIECQFRIYEGIQLRSLVGDLLLVRVAREQDKLLHKRLYNAIRHAILDGSLAPESRLPASRDLAAELHISRNTVLTVYEQLLAEGYIASRRGSGTFVARSAPRRFYCLLFACLADRSAAGGKSRSPDAVIAC
ncbi:HTH-type transcriptional regulatory protein gabR [Pluralibacter gergoviae]|nr:HTH-type transcriptional regulatory protein gabR [Pluralibacter gergoviae]